MSVDTSARVSRLGVDETVGETNGSSIAVAVLPREVPLKRAFDIVIGIVLSIATLPLQIIALLMSAISFRAFPVFRQRRLGLHGEEFTMVKVRSLPATAPSEAAKHELVEVKNSLVGRFLRKSHFDETIQFWQVATGTLSLVGPRPEMIGLSAEYDQSFVQNRTSVRPGITGLWQVSSACDGLIGEAPEIDEYYVENRTWAMEVWIMWQTAVKIITGKRSDYGELKQNA